MKKLALLLIVAALVACKKDNEIVPDMITFTMSSDLKLENKEIKGLDSTQIVFTEVTDANNVIVAYTDAQGNATISLKKDTEYSYSVNSRTYEGPHYYYKKPTWLRSSWTSGNGEVYYQKGWTVTFYKEDRVDDYGSTTTTKTL